MISFSSRGFDDLDRKAKASPETLRVARVQAMERSVRILETEVKTVGLRGQKGSSQFWGVTGAGGDSLGLRSGATARSIVARVFDLGVVVIGSVGSALRSFAAHERGALISGRPWLRIPTRLSQTAAGVDRNAGRSLRGDASTFIFRSKAGRLWIARRGPAFQLLYLLQRTVRLRPRHVLSGALARRLGDIRAQFFGVAGTLATGLGR